MTFEEYIANPMGKSNAVLSGSVREYQRKLYTSKFDNILLRENGKIDYLLYKKADNYYAHIKVPSEVVKNFYYDVLIKFTPPNDSTGSNVQLDRYNVQFYSNDPAFVYTYAYVFNKKGLFFTEMTPRMSKTALRQPANEKNPENQVGYVKSIYFAYLFMKRRGLFKKVNYEGVPTFTIKGVIATVEDAESKIAKRQEEGAKVHTSKKRKDISSTAARTMSRMGADVSSVKVATTKKVKVSKTVASNVQSTKKTKSTKKV